MIPHGHRLQVIMYLNIMIKYKATFGLLKLGWNWLKNTVLAEML